MADEYVVNFEIKYKSIERELKEKIAARTECNDDDYTIEDVENICDELYKHELMSVFNCITFNQIKINNITKNLWEKLKENKNVRENLSKILEEFRIKKFMGIEIDESTLFSSLFCYELLELTHQLISDFSRNPTADLDNELINKMLEEINKM